MDVIEKQLSLQECTKILQNCFKRSNLEVKSRSLTSLSSTVEGFLGQHFSVTVEYNDGQDKKSHRFFMKILNGSLKTIFDITSSLNIYEKENFFYEYILEGFEKIKLDTSFAPRKYFSKKYLIVLEDLSIKGYTPRSKYNLYDYEHCKVALNTLAKFHSCYIYYETAKTKEVENYMTVDKEFPDLFRDPFSNDEDNMAKTWLEFSLQGLLALVELIPKNGSTNEEFSKKIMEVLDQSDNLKQRNKNRKQILLHGDLWTSNILFKYESGAPVDSMIIDYQLYSYGPPSLDVVHLLLANTRRKIREEYYDSLLEYYYASLESYLQDYDINDILPKTEFLETCAEYKKLEKLMCTLDRCTTFMPKTIVNNVVQTDEEFKKFLFDDRVNVMVNTYKNYDTYREVIEEDLLELKDMLCKS